MPQMVQDITVTITVHDSWHFQDCHQNHRTPTTATSTTDSFLWDLPPQICNCLRSSPEELLSSTSSQKQLLTQSVYVMDEAKGTSHSPNCKGWWECDYLAYFRGEKQVLSPSVGNSSNIERRFQDSVFKKNVKDLLEIINGSMAFLTSSC